MNKLFVNKSPVVVCVLVVCSLFVFIFSSIVVLDVNATGYFPQTVTLTNPNNTPFEQIGVVFCEQSDNYSFSSAFGTTFNCNYPARNLDNDIEIITIVNGAYDGIALEDNSIPDGSYYAVFECYVEGSNAVAMPYELPDSYGYALYNGVYAFLYLDDTINNTLVLTTADTIVNSAGLVKLVPVDNDDTPIECPSLQVQINQYNGTYSDFEGLLLGSSNEVIYQGYRNKLQEQYRLGQDSVTLEQLLAEYDGSFQQLITLLSENNLRLLDEYADYIEEQRTLSFNDGYAQGNEDGYNDGYNRGYNKASSEVFGETLLGDTFNMPLNALNNWVLFETSTGLEVTMGGLFTAVIALAVLIIFLKMFAGG